MSATTPIFALPYPVPADPADVPADIQALANRLETVLGGLSGLTYAEFTSAATVTPTTDATAQTLVTCPAITLDGSTAVLLEFFAYAGQPAGAVGASLILSFWDGSTQLARAAVIQNNVAAPLLLPLTGKRRLTPSAGSHTFSARAHVSGGNGVVFAGTGSGVAQVPAFLRVSRA